MRVLAAVTLAGCFYAPGSYHDSLGPLPGHRVRLACVDLAVTLTEDRLAPPPVVQYSFGNRCTHSTIVDLASVRAYGRYANGRVVELAARDPDQELEPLPIDGWWHGQEEIAYATPDGTRPDIVCVDVGRVDHSGDATARWVCMQ